jgi:hypothetical protein
MQGDGFRTLKNPHRFDYGLRSRVITLCGAVDVLKTGFVQRIRVCRCASPTGKSWDHWLRTDHVEIRHLFFPGLPRVGGLER